MSSADEYSPFGGYLAKAKPQRTASSATSWSTFSQKLALSGRRADATLPRKPIAVERKAVGMLSETEAEEWRSYHNISAFGSCPPPVTTFSQLRALGFLPESTLTSFAAQHFKSPTPIQAQAWPVLFHGNDFVGIAKTGSGKTLAFMVPAIAHMTAQPPLRLNDGPLALALAPTRELAQQIEEETRKVLPDNMSCTCVYGGTEKIQQLQKLRTGIHVLIATPGRLLDFLNTKKTNLLRVTYLVLDEADRMLDMGFEPQVREICSQIRSDRQTMMFSATWPKEIEALAKAFMRDFLRVHIGSTELLANPDVAQRFVFTTEAQKFSECLQILSRHKGCRVLIFTKMKRTVDELESQLRRSGQTHTVYGLHGDKEQRQREWILGKFKLEANVVVVATDVAARGLDIKDLQVVVNYDFPMTLDDYVHRIGRTGRAGEKGTAYTFVSKKEPQITPQVVQDLVSLLEKAKQSVPPEMQRWLTERPVRSGSGVSRTRASPFTYTSGVRPTGPTFSCVDDDIADAKTEHRSLFGVSVKRRNDEREDQPTKQRGPRRE